MDTEEKNMLAGAFASGLTNLGLEAYWNFTKPPAETFPYMTVGHHVLPPLDDWIAELGVPLLLYGAGKGLRKPGLIEAAKGAAVYGISEFAGVTLIRAIAEAKRRGFLGQFNIDYDFPTTNIIRRRTGQFNIDWEPPAVTNVIRSVARSAALLPEPTSHSGEVLPFQNDLGY